MKKFFIASIIFLFILSGCTKSNNQVNFTGDYHGIPFKMNENFAGILLSNDAKLLIMRKFDETRYLFFVNDKRYLYDVSTNTYNLYTYLDDKDFLYGNADEDKFYYRVDTKLILSNAANETIKQIDIEKSFSIVVFETYVVVTTHDSDTNDLVLTIFDTELNFINTYTGISMIFDYTHSTTTLYGTSNDKVYVFKDGEFVEIFSFLPDSYVSVLHLKEGAMITEYLYDIESGNPIVSIYSYNEDISLLYSGLEAPNAYSCSTNASYICLTKFDPDYTTSMYSNNGAEIVTVNEDAIVRFQVINDDLYYIEHQKDVFTVYNIDGSIDEVIDLKHLTYTSKNINYVNGNYFISSRSTEIKKDYIYDGGLTELDLISSVYAPKPFIIYSEIGSDNIVFLYPDGEQTILKDTNLNNLISPMDNIMIWNNNSIITNEGSDNNIVNHYSFEGEYLYSYEIIGSFYEYFNTNYDFIAEALVKLENGNWMFIK